MRAIILAAGEGSRLRPFTDDRPKCMVDVGGREMLDRALEALAAVGATEVILVSGYRADVLRERYGDAAYGLPITWVDNPIYDKTNNLYSLWLARDFLDVDHLLLESDLLFDKEILERLIESKFPNAAVVDAYRPELNGTIIKAEDDGTSTQMVLKAQQGPDYDHSDSLKTVNIYRFEGGFMREHYLPRLNRYVEEKRTDKYYEAVLAELVTEGAVTLGAVKTAPLKWAEVDTPEDRVLAEKDFPPTS